MADDMRIAFEAIARKLAGMHDGDILREGVRMLAHALMEAEVETHVGAAPHERTTTRTGQRNGYRERAWDTRVGTIDLRVPRVRDGSYAPSLLEPRRRAEQALASVVQQAYVSGVSTRRVDDLVRSLGMDGISRSQRSQVSRICQGLDDEVRRFRERTLEGPYPYVWLDATFVKARQDGRVASLAVLVAIGVTAEGERQVLGVEASPGEDRESWMRFLRGMVGRGLSGVRLVTSDAHPGLRDAIARTMHGATWQRCRVHFLRNAMASVPARAREVVVSTVRVAFLQTDAPATRAQWAGHGRVPGALRATGDAHGRRPRGCARLSGLPGRPLAQGVVDEPARAAEQGDQAPDGRGRDLPGRGVGTAADRGGPGRAAR